MKKREKILAVFRQDTKNKTLKSNLINWTSTQLKKLSLIKEVKRETT